MARRVLRWTGAALLALLLALALFAAFLHTAPGRDFLLGQLGRFAPASGLRISAGELRGSVLGHATFNDVEFRDADGVLFLAVPEVELDWRPWRWLTSGLDLRLLRLERGTLHALPHLLPGDPDAPVLPDFDIRVDRLAVERLTIAEGIAGAARVVDLAARADVRAGLVDVSATGELGGGDVFTALVHARPDGDAFDLELDWRAPRGGVLAALAGLQESSTLRLTGAGSWQSWDGRLLAMQGRVERARLGLANRGGIFGVAGYLRPGGMLTGLAARAAGDRIDLRASGTLRESLLAGRFAVSGSGISARGAGAVDLAGNRVDGLQIRAHLRDPALFGANVVLEQARLEGTLDGPFRDSTFSHEARIERINAGTLSAQGILQRGTARWDGTRIALPLRASVARITSGNALFDPRLVNGGVAGNLIWQGKALTTPELALRFQGLEGRLAFDADLASGLTRLSGPVRAQGLPFANIGTVDATADISFAIGGGVPWRLEAAVNGRLAQVSNQSITTLAGSNIRFSGGLALGASRPLVFNRMRLTASKFTALLDGRVQDGRTMLTGSGRHTDYGPFRVEAELAQDGPRATLVLANPLPAAGLADVRVTLAPAGDGFAISAAGGSLLGPFDGVFDLTLPPGGQPRIGISRLDVADTRATGALRLAGQLLLSRGGISGTLALSTRAGGQAFAADLAAQDARFGGATPLGIARGTIDAEGLLVGGSTTLSGHASLQGVSWGTLFLGRVAARTTIANGMGSFDAALSGRRGGQFDLALNGSTTPGRIALAARGNYAGRAITMPRRAVLLRQDDGGWALAETQLGFGQGFVIASGRFGGDQPMAAQLALADLPLDLAGALAGDLDVGGTVSGEVAIGSGPNGLLTGSARVLIAGLTRSSTLLSSRPLDLALVADLSETLLQTRAVLRDDGGARGRVQARIGNLPRGGTLAERLYAGDLAAGLRWFGPADVLWRLAAVELIDLDGDLVIAANATGTLAEPLVRGSLSGDGLRLRSALTGTDITGLAARGVFSGSRLNLTSLAGNAPGGGRLSGSGFLDFSGMAPGRGPQMDLRIAARDARILDLPNMGATVTGPLRIISQGNGGTIAGRLRTSNARWRLGTSEALASLPVVAIREINRPADAAPVLADASPWRYLIDAEAGGDGIAVDGMGLDSRWAGTVRLRGTTADPRLGGEVRIVPRQGFYSFAGTRFDITRGRITFDEAVALDPRVELLAETAVDGLVVAVNVAGSASRPDITFNSTPALPEEELLARLLFGGSVTSLSATDALQLGAAVAALRGGAGLDPINALRRAVGLDRLRIVPADPALGRGTALALGKNVTRRFYAEIVTDGAGYNASELEFRVTGWLSLLGTVSTVGRHAVAAEVRRDY